MKKLLMVLLIITAFSGCSKSFTSENYSEKINSLEHMHVTWDKGYESLQQMTKEADVIMTGYVIANKPEIRGDLVFTIQQVEAAKVLKGDLNKGDTVDILFTGGELDKKITPIADEATLMNSENKYILFLELTDEGHYLVMGGYQGYSKETNSKFNLSSINKKDKTLEHVKLEDIELMKY